MFNYRLSFTRYAGFFACLLMALAVPDIRADGDTYWDTRFSTHGLNGKVKAIAISESNNVVAGGDFNVGGGVLVNHVGLWNGSSWSGFGSGVNGSVNAVAIRDDEIFAGGSFSIAGNVPASNIARWDGSAWQAMGAGLNGPVYAILVDGDNVYAGGTFTASGGQTLNYIARWNGASWSALGSGMNSGVVDLEMIGYTLYAAGSFTQAGGLTVNHIARWNGSSWMALDTGLNHTVYAIDADGPLLYAVGDFTTAGGITVNRVACFDGSGWTALGSGMNDVVMDVQAVNGKVYAGGLFTDAGGTAVHGLAVWDGTWKDIGGGVSGVSFPSVNAIGVQGAQVYVGGGFTKAGTITSYYFARWDPTPQLNLFTRVQPSPIATDVGSSQGASWADIDNDGDQDLFVANDNGENNFLYRNLGNGSFYAGQGSIVGDGGNSMGACWGDYDNDGFVDLYVVNRNNENNFLYNNDGDGTFTRINSDPPVNDGGESWGASWADYDNDGWIDLFVANRDGLNYLYHNSGNGSFSRVYESPFINDKGSSVCGVWGDYDNDGDQDLFVANDGWDINFLYRNDGSGNFTRVTSDPLTTEPMETRSASWCDFDRDNDLDLLLVNSGQANCLYRNDGNNQFVRLDESRIHESNDHSRGSAWADFDNDGDMDVFISNRKEDCFLFKNDGDNFEKFKVLNTEARGCAWGDYDSDGMQNLFVCSEGSSNYLYDTYSNSNHWIQIHCKGVISNASGIGARIRIQSTIDGETVWQMQEISSQTGFGGQNAMTASFGLGSDAVVDAIRIEWPGGIVWDTTQVVADQVLFISERETNFPPVAVDDQVSVLQEASIAIAVLDNDSDPDGDELSVISLQTGDTRGDVYIASSGKKVIYTGPEGYYGSDHFSYTVYDGRGGYDEGDVYVDIEPVVPPNRPPVAEDDVFYINKNEVTTLDVLQNDSDPDGDDLTIQNVITTATEGTVIINVGDKALTYIPLSNQEYSDSFLYIATDGQDGLDTATVFITVMSGSAIEDRTEPVCFNLSQNHPNPFNPITHIDYSIAQPGPVSLKVYDMRGREVAELVNEVQSPGHYQAQFDGSGLASGIYAYRLEAGRDVITRKMILMK